jgi:TPR repeat protein
MIFTVLPYKFLRALFPLRERSCFGQFVVGSAMQMGLLLRRTMPRLFDCTAAKGHASARVNLGGMFKLSLGVAQDRAVAIRWYRLAAAQGYASAQTSLTRLVA